MLRGILPQMRSQIRAEARQYAAQHPRKVQRCSRQPLRELKLLCRWDPVALNLAEGFCTQPGHARIELPCEVHAEAQQIFWALLGGQMKVVQSLDQEVVGQVGFLLRLLSLHFRLRQCADLQRLDVHRGGVEVALRPKPPMGDEVGDAERAV